MPVSLIHVRAHFRVNWTVVFAGWMGIGAYRRLPMVEEINSYATELLDGHDGADRCLAELATLTDPDSPNIEAWLSALAAREQYSFERAIRKWVVCIVENTLPLIRRDPVYGLLDLREMWSDLGDPEASPLLIQGVNNDRTPEAYYTPTNLESMLHRHAAWIRSQILQLGQD